MGVDKKKIRMPDFLIRRKIRTRSKTAAVLIFVVATNVNIYILVTLWYNWLDFSIYMNQIYKNIVSIYGTQQTAYLISQLAHWLILEPYFNTIMYISLSAFIGIYLSMYPLYKLFIKLQEMLKPVLPELDSIGKLTLLGSITILASTMISVNNGLITTTFSDGVIIWARFSLLAFIISVIASVFLILIAFKEVNEDILTGITILILMSIMLGFITYFIAIIINPPILQIFLYLFGLRLLPL